ncbi:MAG: GTP-binding protein YchF [Parcubacteria group bacterium Gr01-1014_66]|nr:MAG: GTP-binding protein YchF [Parcubacteria group bacterium Gr01-1014_66]
MKIGIVGLPNVGKSTLFSALTRQKVDIANYPFCTIEPNVGVVAVPDERLQKLANLSHSKKVIPAVVEFLDIAGLVKGAAQGQGLGNKFLSHIREVDAIAEVVRIFEDSDILRVAGTKNPVSDIEIVEYELTLKDLETVLKQLDHARIDARAHKKGAEEEVKILEKLECEINKGLPARRIVLEWNEHEQELFRSYDRAMHLLNAKPLIYIFNVSEKDIQTRWAPDATLQKKIEHTPWVAISAKIESDLAEMPDHERKEYLASIGIHEHSLDTLIRTSYKTLQLITFFTTGEDETRAWTIPHGSAAPRAGRAIHSDFEEKFIRAEVIAWDTLLDAGSYARARELGLLRTEGKNYIVHDGDVIEFKM